MSVETCLGWLRLSYHKAGLQLKLTATAKASEPLPIETTSSLDHNKESSIGAYRPWVAGSNNLCLVLDVSASDEGLISILLEQDLIQLAGELLAEAELFQQLDFRTQLSIHPRSALEPASTDHLGSVRIRASHKRESIRPKKPHHRLLKGVPLADLKPPENIRIIELKEVRLSVHITTLQQNIRKKATHRKSDSHPRTSTSLLANPLPAVNQSSDVQNGEMLDERNKGDNIPLFSSASLSVVPSNHHLDDLEMLDSFSLPVSDAPHGKPATNQEASGKQHCQRPPVVSYNGATPLFSDDATPLTNALDLIDAAVRLAFTKKPNKLARGIKRTGDNFPTRLSDLAPALFSPGYLSGLSQRTVFIPTISRAFATKISTNAVSPSLKAKLDQLASYDPCSNGAAERRGAAGENDRATTQTVHDAVKTRIWRMAQETLHNPASARRLKPLTGSHGKRGLLGAGKDDILEPVATSAWGFGLEMLEDEEEDEMLSDRETDEILEHYERDEDDLLENLLAEPPLDEFHDHQLAVRSPAISFDRGSSGVRVVHSMSLSPYPKPQTARFEPIGPHDMSNEEMLL